MTTLFISDLHLTESKPEITDCFFRFLRQDAIHADALYILGDLFEFWVGDDDNSPFNLSVKQALKTLTSSGVPCFFIQGNRDFLVGERFARETGVILLDEESVITLYGKKVLILHGDTLCTDDVKYQEYRAKVHQKWLQIVYNLLPLWLKKKVVSKVQGNIGEDKKMKSLTIMDVNQTTVEQRLKASNVALMVHGHTHRPDIHHFTANNQACTRIVLGDWYEQGSVLKFTESDYSLLSLSFEDTED